MKWALSVRIARPPGQGYARQPHCASEYGPEPLVPRKRRTPSFLGEEYPKQQAGDLPGMQLPVRRIRPPQLHIADGTVGARRASTRLELRRRAAPRRTFREQADRTWKARTRAWQHSQRRCDTSTWSFSHAQVCGNDLNAGGLASPSRPDSADLTIVVPSCRSSRWMWFLRCRMRSDPLDAVMRLDALKCRDDRSRPCFPAELRPRGERSVDGRGLDSGFHRGQLATSVSTDQTISGVAAISISPLAIAGAPVSISTTFTP